MSYIYPTLNILIYLVMFVTLVYREEPLKNEMNLSEALFRFASVLFFGWNFTVGFITTGGDIVKIFLNLF
jgi:hypothetical protein